MSSALGLAVAFGVFAAATGGDSLPPTALIQPPPPIAPPALPAPPVPDTESRIGSAPAPVRFEATIVVAERAPRRASEIPAAVSTLERSEIERRPAASLAELVDSLPGVLVVHGGADAGGPPMASARGFFGGGEAEYLQLRVDGVAVADPETGLADWRALRALSIERVEALRGPAAAVYGDTALGGVVEVVTRRRAGDGERGVATLSAGSFDAAAADALVWLGRPGDRLSARLAGTWAESDGWREHAASVERGVELGLDLPSDGVDAAAGRPGWRLDLAVHERERDEPGPLGELELERAPRSSGERFRFDVDRARRRRAALVFDGAAPSRALDGTWRVALASATRDADAVRTLLLAPELGDRRRRDTDTEAWSLTAESDLRLGADGLAHLGADGARERLRTGYRPVDEDGVAGAEDAAARVERRRSALFAGGSFGVGSRLRLVAGGRWDRIEDLERGGARLREDAWSPRLGATVDLGRDWIGFVQAARAFKAPTPDQRFDPRPFPDFAGGSFTISSPDLVAQRARTLELGVRRSTGAMRAEGVAYRIEMEREIDFDPATFRYANLGATVHDGLEAALDWRGDAMGDRLAGPRASLSYSWTRVEPRQGERRGRQLKNVPRHRLRAAAGADWGRAWSLDLAATWLAGRYLDDAERFPVEDAATADLRLERRFSSSVARGGGWRARLDLLNLTDERWVAVGYVLTDFEGVDRPLQFAAAGRAIRVGVELGF